MRSVQSRSQLGTANLHLWVLEGGVGVEVALDIVLEKRMAVVFVYQKNCRMIQSIAEKDGITGGLVLSPRGSPAVQNLN